MVKNPPAMQETWLQFLGWKSAGEGNDSPLQFSCLDRGACQATVHGVAESLTGLSD